jgi:hypothetical protein
LFVVNEVANKDTGLEVCDGRAYIEFKNIATFPISIEDLDFTLEVRSGSREQGFVGVGSILLDTLIDADPSLDELIGPGEFLIVCRTASGGFDFDIADGNSLSLRYSPTGRESEAIELPLPGFGGPSATYQRLDDLDNGQRPRPEYRYALPTPGATNFFQQDDVRIVAFGVVQNQSGATVGCATGQEGVEIQNFQPNPVPLGGLVLSDEKGPIGAFVIPANTVIEAFGRFSICKDPTDDGGFPFDVTAGSTVTLYDVRQPLDSQEVSTRTTSPPISPAPALPKTPAPSPAPVPLPGSVESAAAVNLGKDTLSALVGSIGGGNTEAATALSNLFQELSSDRGTEKANKALDAIRNNVSANPTFPTFSQATNNNALDAFLNNVPANPNVFPPGFRGGFRN